MRYFLLLLCLLYIGSAQAQITGRAYQNIGSAPIEAKTATMGVAQVKVTAYNATGQAVASTLTNAQGYYHLPVLAGMAVRVEFGQLPAGHTPNAGQAAVQFVRSPAEAHLSLMVASLYTGPSPAFAQTVFPTAPPALRGSDPAGRAKFRSIFLSNSSDKPKENGIEAPFGGLGAGSLWALAHAPSQPHLYAAAFIKRHSPLGPLGPGGIYRLNLNNQAIEPYLNLDEMGVKTAPPRLVKERGLGGEVNAHDSLTFAYVGKAGLGGMDISDDGQRLYVVNLYDRQLYQIQLPTDPAARPTAADIKAIELPLSGCTGGQARPFAVKYFADKVYVGITCDAQQSQKAEALKMMVYVITPFNDNEPVSPFPLQRGKGSGDRGLTPLLGVGGLYPRGTLDYGMGNWLPWTDDYNQAIVENTSYWMIYPQPMLSDIEFDTDGSMVLAIMDRLGHQAGDGQQFWPKGALQPHTYQGLSGGDVLRAAWTGDHYELEQNGQVGRLQSAGRNNKQGPGGGEFYFDDSFKAAGITWHQESAMGGLALLPHTNELLVSTREPETDRYTTGGVKWFNNQTGASTRALSVFESGKQLGYFWKTNNVGDVELIAQAPPIEVGNRAWIDLNANGQQDADEPPLANVILALYQNGKAIATTTTDANGLYFFNELNVVEGIKPHTDYQIRVALQQAAYGTLQLTKTHQATSPDLDNDATTEQGQAVIHFKTGAAGQSMHQLDIGFRCNESLADCNPTEPFGLTLYPNPATDKTNVLYRSQASDGRITLELTDTNGRVIERQTGQLERGFYRYLLDVRPLSTAPYQLTITDDLSRSTKTLIKQ